MDIFSELADRFEQLKKQIEQFLDDVYHRVSCFETLATEQQQELVADIANTGGQLRGQVLSVCWGDDFEEKAILELQNANKTYLAKDLIERFDRIVAKIEAFLPYSENAILERLAAQEFAPMHFDLEVGSDLSGTIKRLRNISERVINSEEKDKQRTRITKDEANVRARHLLRDTPSWDWTARKLAKLIPCSLGWIPSLPVWRVYHEKRKELRRNKTIDTVSLSDELEAVLGKGEKDEVLKQLIAEQEGEEREDARRARLYVSRQNKVKRSRK